MKNKSLSEKPLKIGKIYSGKAVNFRADTVRLPDGGTATREFLDHPGAVAVLPLLENGDILLVRQHRYPVGKATLEIPAGKLLSANDPPRERARAELREETGYTAASLERIMSFWPTPAFSNEILHVFIARGLKAGKPSPDEDEFISAERMRFDKARALIRSGKIRDAKTIIAIQAYALGNGKK
jgi:ADP-ribose pyrophosphatase